MARRTLLFWKDLKRTDDAFGTGETEDQFASGRYMSAYCGASDALHAMVRITGAVIGGVNTVETVDPTIRAKMPAHGMIARKYDDTRCLVQIDDVVNGFTGLNAGDPYCIGVDGQLSKLIPDAAPGGIFVIQMAGYAWSATAVRLVPTLTIFTKTG